jgi:hypothetical protein
VGRGVRHLGARRYASTNPYDWGAPRPLNRPSCYDHPLVQYDLFRKYPLQKPSLAGDVSWLITAPRMPTNYTRSYTMYGGGGWVPDNYGYINKSFAKTTDPNTGQPALDTTRFNLAAPFAAAERCRDIVCWAVDWKAYEDFESAQSGPYDASVSFIDSAGVVVDSELTQYPPDLGLHWATAQRTGLVPPSVQEDNANSARHLSKDFRGSWFGVYGADRDGNGKFDQGPIPSSARLRAVSVGRWHFYDRRLISALRN